MTVWAHHHLGKRQHVACIQQIFVLQKNALYWMIFRSLNWLLGSGLNLFPQLSERASIHKLTAMYSGKGIFSPKTLALRYCYGLNYVPGNSGLNTQCARIRRCSFWEVIRWRWGHEGGVLTMRLVPSEGEIRELTLSLSLPCEDIAKKWSSASQKERSYQKQN